MNDISGVTPAAPGQAHACTGADAREALGRLVHDVRLAAEAARAEQEGRRRFNLDPWEDRPPWQRELDMDIGETVAAAGLERAERAEATLARIRKEASEWAALATADDWGESVVDTFKADVGRALLAILGEEGTGDG